MEERLLWEARKPPSRKNSSSAGSSRKRSQNTGKKEKGKDQKRIVAKTKGLIGLPWTSSGISWRSRESMKLRDIPVIPTFYRRQYLHIPLHRKFGGMFRTPGALRKGELGAAHRPASSPKRCTVDAGGSRRQNLAKPPHVLKKLRNSPRLSVAWRIILSRCSDLRDGHQGLSADARAPLEEPGRARRYGLMVNDSLIAATMDELVSRRWRRMPRPFRESIGSPPINLKTCPDRLFS